MKVSLSPGARKWIYALELSRSDLYIEEYAPDGGIE